LQIVVFVDVLAIAADVKTVNISSSAFLLMPFPLTFPSAFSLRLRSEDEGNLAKNPFLPLNFPSENKACFAPCADRQETKKRTHLSSRSFFHNNVNNNVNVNVSSHRSHDTITFPTFSKSIETITAAACSQCSACCRQDVRCDAFVMLAKCVLASSSQSSRLP
jgi:hypothetical protein